MRITTAGPRDFERLTEIWEGAVRASHDFLGEADILYYREQVRNVYLFAVELFAARDESGSILGFMGISRSGAVPGSGDRLTAGKASLHPCGGKVEMLFVDPACMGRGVGSALIRHAAALLGVLEVDVNEQNPTALAFYERRGFVRTGRSALDGQGRPFPLIHMRLA